MKKHNPNKSNTKTNLFEVVVFVVILIVGILMVLSLIFPLYHEKYGNINYEYISGYVNTICCCSGTTTIVIDGEEFCFIGEHKSIPIEENIMIVFHERYLDNIFCSKNNIYVLDEWNVI